MGYLDIAIAVHSVVINEKFAIVLLYFSLPVSSALKSWFCSNIQLSCSQDNSFLGPPTGLLFGRGDDHVPIQ